MVGQANKQVAGRGAMLPAVFFVGRFSERRGRLETSPCRLHISPVVALCGRMQGGLCKPVIVWRPPFSSGQLRIPRGAEETRLLTLN